MTSAPANEAVDSRRADALLTVTGARPRRVVIALEAALVGLLGLSWLGGWFVTRSNLNGLPPGTRNVELRTFSTSMQLWAVPLLIAITVLCLLGRHRAPIVAFWIGVAAVAFYSLLFPLVDISEIGSTVALLVLTFWAALQARRLWPLALGATASAGVSTFRFFGIQDNMAIRGQARSPVLASLTETAGIIMMVIGVIAAARLMHRLRAQADELGEQNRELHYRRLQAEEAAVVDERLRISRELHDVVAHHISAMTVHAGGAQRALRSNVDAADRSLAQIATSGRDAIGELQRMLGFLRGHSPTEAEPRGPAPSLRRLGGLIDSYGEDLRVELEVEDSLEAVPPSVDLSAYRIVQEALTNVVKHSDSGRARIHITSSADETSITVANDVSSFSSTNGRALAHRGTGHGLIGMRERVALHNGSLMTGPTPDGGWQVKARLVHAGSDLS